MRALGRAWIEPRKMREGMLLGYVASMYSAAPLISVLFVFKCTSPWYFYSLFPDSISKGTFGYFLGFEAVTMVHEMAVYLCGVLIQIYYFVSTEALLQIFR
jgi:hypothetical protein